MTTEQLAENRGRWWGPDFCPHIGNPVIDGCYFCGRAVPNPANGEHDHTMYEKKGFRGASKDRYRLRLRLLLIGKNDYDH